MGGNDANLNIKVTAQDQASPALVNLSEGLVNMGGATRNLTADFENFSKEAETAESQTANVSQTMQKSTSIWGDVAKGVMAGYTAYNLASQAVQAFKGFLESSMQQAMQDESVMAMLKVNIDNAGLSYSKLNPQVEAYARAQELNGFTNDETTASMGRLILLTGNYTQAVALNQLAMDLSRNKGMELGQATQTLAMILEGSGARALSTYGLTFKDGASAAEILTQLQEKLKGSTSAFAGTAAGELKTVTAQWDDMKKSLGEDLMPIAKEFFIVFEENLPTIKSLIDALGSSLSILGKGIDMAFGHLPALFAGLAEYTKVITDTNKPNDQLVASLDKVADGFNKAHKGAHITGEEIAGLPWEQQKKLIDDYSGSVSTATNVFAGLGVPAKDVTSQLEKHADAVKNLTISYDDMKDKAATDLADMAASFSTKMTSISDSIGKTKEQIKNLTNSFNDTQTDNTSKVADDIVASEKKIADIKQQISTSTSAKQVLTLQDQLKTEEANYNSTADFRTTNAQAIADAETRAGKTALQREIDNFNTQKQRETDSYNQKMTDLQATLNQEMTNQSTEIALYKDKTDKEKVLMDTAQDDFIKASQDRLVQTTAEIEAEISLFNQLASAISAVSSQSSSAGVKTIKTPTPASVPAKHEMGGMVNAPRGTEVPVILHGGEEIIPAEQVSSRGGSNITVHINYPTVRNNSDLQEMKKQVNDVFRNILANHKISFN